MDNNHLNTVRNCIEDLSAGLQSESNLLKEHLKNDATKESIQVPENKIPSCFSIDKYLLKKLFKRTKSNSFNDIYTRLLVLDSTYSTQMTKRYYGIGELAETIYLLSTRTEFRHNLEKFAENPTEESRSSFKFNKKAMVLFIDRTNDSKRGVSNLFSEKYGINKNAEDKGLALSLITKYAYFETQQCFPIFDSIANERAPLIWHYCVSDSQPSLKKTDDIIEYISNINKLKNLLGVSYDDLDCFLWHLGKLMRGNFSLIFSMEEYIHYKKRIKTYIPEDKDNNDKEFILKFLKSIYKSTKTKPYIKSTLNLAMKLLMLE